MRPEIRRGPVAFTIHGFALQHDRNKRYGEEILALLGRVWPVIKAGNVAHDGLNRVVYDADHSVFAGVVLTEGWESNPAATKLERRFVQLARHAFWRHVGPYSALPATCAAMNSAITAMGLRTGWPMIEIYGHWTSDESKFETDICVALR